MVILTLWPLSKWRDALPLLRAVRPHGVMLHSDPDTLAQSAPAVAKALRAESALQRGGQPPAIWLGVAGDSGYTRTRKALAALSKGDEAGRAAILRGLLATRTRAITAAQAAGASCLMWDPEAAWKRGTPGFDAAAAVELVGIARSAGLRQLVTSYDCPGYHAAFPWHAWDCADGWAPQIYAAPDKGAEPDPAASLGRARFLLHDRFWQTAERSGWIQPRPRTAYVQLHHVVARETACIADQCTDVCGWASSLADADGIRAARALVAIEDAGVTGPGRVARWQASKGLTPDGLLGPKSFGALGL